MNRIDKEEWVDETLYFGIIVKGNFERIQSIKQLLYDNGLETKDICYQTIRPYALRIEKNS